jgi:hypothetical protein
LFLLPRMRQRGSTDGATSRAAASSARELARRGPGSAGGSQQCDRARHD